jgi:antitoxin ParD1/3/4
MIHTMSQQKLSVSVSEPIAAFVKRYQGEHQLKTKSEVIERALKLLRERELELAYAEAALEDDPIWDVTLKDGLAKDDWS